MNKPDHQPETTETDSTDAGPPPSLARFALLTAGPRDLIINAVINTPIAWFFYSAAESVRLAGDSSVMSMLIPMTLILSFLTTFFGYFAGIQRRKAGLATPAWREGTPWFKQALLWSAVWAAMAVTACVVVDWAVQTLAPELAMPGWAGVVLIGAYAGVLAYVLHARAVMAAARMGAE